MSDQMSKEEIMETVASESVRRVREAILKYLEATQTPDILGHAAILSIADDIRANVNTEELKTLDTIVDTFHEKVELAQKFAKEQMQKQGVVN